MNTLISSIRQKFLDTFGSQSVNPPTPKGLENVPLHPAMSRDLAKRRNEELPLPVQQHDDDEPKPLRTIEAHSIEELEEKIGEFFSKEKTQFVNSLDKPAMTYRELKASYGDKWAAVQQGRKQLVNSL